MDPRHNDTDPGLNALLITVDGGTKPVTLPTGRDARLAIARHLGGPSWLGQCTPTCSPDSHLVTVGLLEIPPAGTPRNDYATAVVEVMRHAPLEAPIFGPALIMGRAEHDDVPTSLEPGQKQAIEDFVATWYNLLT
ncbi:hypothetical protein [Kitasatospora cineracea]|uniref:hypothetical protein n=1 Tax=Kitasatospora cineracea TaxID=88074 RepID=UPI0033D26079